MILKTILVEATMTRFRTALLEKTEAEYTCAACNAYGREACPDADTFLDRDGSPLPDAALLPKQQWVCSTACRSQQMFAAATPDQQDAMKRLELALREVEEVVPVVRDVAGTWISGAGFTLDMLRLTAIGIQEALAVDEEPAWTNTPSPEDEAGNLTRRLFLSLVKRNEQVCGRVCATGMHSTACTEAQHVIADAAKAMPTLAELAGITEEFKPGSGVDGYEPIRGVAR